MSKWSYHSKLWLVMVFVFLIVAGPALSQKPQPAVIAYSQGVLQPDKSVLYSVLVVSNTEAVGDLSITISAPEDAVTSEAVIVPDGATLTSDEADTSAFTWQVDAMDASSVLGPFTIRVTLPDTVKDIPAGVPASVTWTTPETGSADASQREGTLEVADTSAIITLDANGTVDDKGEPTVLQIPNTDIWIHVPKEALSQAVTLVFTRLTIDDVTVPAGMDDTWWCVLVTIDSESVVKLAKPITIALPTRQILTPGIDVQVLTRTGSEDWQALDTVQGLGINGTGAYAGIMITDTIPQMLAVGVPSKIRQESKGFAPGGGGFESFNSGFSGGGGGFGGQIGGFGGGAGRGGFQGGFSGGGFQGGFSTCSFGATCP